MDGAASFGFAHARLGPRSAIDAAGFLEHHLLPAYRELGVSLVEVVTDGGHQGRTYPGHRDMRRSLSRGVSQTM